MVHDLSVMNNVKDNAKSYSREIGNTGRFRSSRFNVPIAEAASSGKIFYNTLTGSISRLSQDLARILESAKVPVLDTQLLDHLLDLGLIVESGSDELGHYGKIHQKWKEGRECVEFTSLFTYDCNFACPYCYQGRGEKGEQIHGFKYMSQELLNSMGKFMKRIVGIKDSRKVGLVLYGGEPFLVPGMCKNLTDDIADWVHDRGSRFHLHALSNGSLITEELVDWLSDYHCRLQIPVDGAKTTHNKYRFYKDSGKGSYEDIMHVLEMTKNTDVETHIRISLTDETYPTMETLLDDLKDRGLTHVYPDFCYITAFTEACSAFKDHCLPDAKLFKVMPELWEKAHGRGFPLEIRPQVQPLPCSSLSDGSYIIDPFGDVYKCWELVGIKKHKVGKIDRNGTLKRNKVYEDMLKRNPLAIDECRNHSYLPACGGGCVCKAVWQKRTYHAAGCGTERFLLKDKVRMYLKTINSSNAEVISKGNLKLEIIEGSQKPKMSHCYVLV